MTFTAGGSQGPPAIFCSCRAKRTAALNTVIRSGGGSEQELETRGHLEGELIRS
jgi:hypothetical protein